MALMGMDTAAGANCAKQFQTGSEQVRALVGTLTNAINFQWEGADAQRVKGDWSGNMSKALATIAENLAQWSQLITQNVQEQEAASAK